MKHRFRWFLPGLLVLLLSVVFIGGIAAQDAPANCPRGQGYWKSTAAWPVADLTIAGQVYSQAELLIILNMPPQGDASLILAHQLIAAKLNMLSGLDATAAAGLIAQAETLLSGYPGRLPYNIAPASSEGSTMTNVSSVLEAYNAGLLSLNCALTPTATLSPTLMPEGTPTVVSTPLITPSVTPQGTPAVTATPSVTVTPGGPPIIIIEGPVTAININIITIYDIDIELNVDDPLLLVIKIGDIVRVEGSIQDRGGVIIIVAVTVIIVNVDIDIDTGEVWRDEGNCANPPPPWAPANGWRRRCGGGNNNGGGNNGGGRGNKDDDDDD